MSSSELPTTERPQVNKEPSGMSRASSPNFRVPTAGSLPCLAASPAQPHPPGHPYMDTFRRLFSCGPIFGKKTEEEEGDAAKEVTGAR